MARGPLPLSGADCIFCQISAGLTPDPLVLQTQTLFVVCPRAPINPGHALIIPQQHIRNLYSLPDDLSGPILQLARQPARALKSAFGAEGVTLRQNNDAAGDQHVFHFHLHVIPRYAGGGERMYTQQPMLPSKTQAEIAARLRTAMNETTTFA